MGRKKKYRKDKDLGKIHPLFSGDPEYIASRTAPYEPPPRPPGERKRIRPPDGKLWRKVTPDEWVAMFPASPPAFRKIARGLAELGDGVVTFELKDDSGDYCPPMSQLASRCHVHGRTLTRYLPVFEAYGVVEVHRWRRRIDRTLGLPSVSVRVFRGSVVPADWAFDGGNFGVSARQAA